MNSTNLDFAPPACATPRPIDFDFDTFLSADSIDRPADTFHWSTPIRKAPESTAKPGPQPDKSNDKSTFTALVDGSSPPVSSKPHMALTSETTSIVAPLRRSGWPSIENGPFMTHSSTPMADHESPVNTYVREDVRLDQKSKQTPMEFENSPDAGRLPPTDCLEDSKVSIRPSTVAPDATTTDPAQETPARADRYKFPGPVVDPLTQLHLELFKQQSMRQATLSRLHDDMHIRKAGMDSVDPSELDHQQARWPLPTPAPEWFDIKLAVKLPHDVLEQHYDELFAVHRTNEELQRVYEQFKIRQDTLYGEYSAKEMQLDIEQAKERAEQLASSLFKRETTAKNTSAVSCPPANPPLPVEPEGSGCSAVAGLNHSTLQDYQSQLRMLRDLAISKGNSKEDESVGQKHLQRMNPQALPDIQAAQLRKEGQECVRPSHPVVKALDSKGMTPDNLSDLSSLQPRGDHIGTSNESLGVTLDILVPDEEAAPGSAHSTDLPVIAPMSAPLLTDTSHVSAFSTTKKKYPNLFSEPSSQTTRHLVLKQVKKPLESGLEGKFATSANSDAASTYSRATGEDVEDLRKKPGIHYTTQGMAKAVQQYPPGTYQAQRIMTPQQFQHQLHAQQEAIARLQRQSQAWTIAQQARVQQAQQKSFEAHGISRGTPSVLQGQVDSAWERFRSARFVDRNVRNAAEGPGMLNADATAVIQSQKDQELAAKGKNKYVVAMPIARHIASSQNSYTVPRAPIMPPFSPKGEQAANHILKDPDFPGTTLFQKPTVTSSSMTGVNFNLAKPTAKAVPGSPRMIMTVPLYQLSGENSAAPAAGDKQPAADSYKVRAPEADRRITADAFDFCDTNSEDESLVLTPQSEVSFKDIETQAESPVELQGNKKAHVTGIATQYKTVYHVFCDHIGSRLYLDSPTLDETVHRGHLAGNSAVSSDMECFLFEDPRIAFVVTHEIKCHQGSMPNQKATSGKAFPVYIRPISNTLLEAIESLAKYSTPIDYVRDPLPPGTGMMSRPVGNSLQTRDPVSRKKRYNQTFLYHHRQELSQARGSIAEVCVLSKFLRTSPLVTRFYRIDKQFSAGKVTAETFEFLFAPNDILVSSVYGPKHSHAPESKHYAAFVLRNEPHTNETRGVTTLHCWAWSYNGEKLTRRAVSFEVTVPKMGETANIADLAAYPLRHAGEDIRLHLKRRGTFFWEELRFKKHVAYDGWGWDKEWNVAKESRFMVDYKLYSKVHPKSPWLNIAPLLKQHNDPYPESVSNTENEIGDLSLMIPADVIAFSLTDRRHWVRLHLDQVRHVDWNYAVFNEVFVARQIIDLACALVFSRAGEDKITPAERRAQRKALTIHFHGPPGCGKTQLAHAVAEVIELPTYIVTAGTIASSPELWNKFVGHVHLLATAWEFVLLVEEADAFLAKRIPGSDGSFDHHDVGIMAWFTKLLDEFPGIIILTSNTIPTEEIHPAVRSRINASLAFGPLDEKARMKMWKRKWNTAGWPSELSSPEDHVKLQELAKREMDGWEINSVFEIARDYARFQERLLEWSDIEMALGVQTGASQAEKKNAEKK